MPAKGNTFILLGCLLVAPAAVAQTVPNPSKVQYDVSPDHGKLAKYTLGYFLPGASTPVQTADLAIVTPDGAGKVEQPISAVPLGFGAYTAKIKAVAATGEESEWSAASNAFERRPFPVGNVLVVK